MKYKLVTFYVELLDKMIRILIAMREHARPTTPTTSVVEEGMFDSLFGNINKIADESEFNSKIIQK